MMHRAQWNPNPRRVQESKHSVPAEQHLPRYVDSQENLVSICKALSALGVQDGLPSKTSRGKMGLPRSQRLSLSTPNVAERLLARGDWPSG